MRTIIIGSGPAGYTAAIYSARACIETLLITGITKGGQLTTTYDVENYPGFAESIEGPWLMDQMEKQAIKNGVKIINEVVLNVKKHNNNFIVDTGQQILVATAVVIATGAEAKWLNLPSEQKYRGHGVSSCATCDGFFYRNKRVLVVGGGNTAVTEALYLANIADSVTLVHRRDELRAEKTLQEKLFKHPKIVIKWFTKMIEVLGGTTVTGVKLENIHTKEIIEMPMDGIFIAIGHKPNTEIFQGLIDMDDEGYIMTTNTKTSVEGIFAAGDVQDKIYKQAITAAASGCIAALEIEKFYQNQH